MQLQKSLGSPPPMRGKGTLPLLPSTVGGITPAYAGKSFVFLKFRPPTRDHPRLCGEKSTIKLYHTFVLGSPPSMRGKDRKVNKRRYGRGITPAYAGKRAE